MGWQDRDWAKLNEQELGALYGARTPQAGKRSINVARWVAWSGIAALTVAVAGWAVTHRIPRETPLPAVVTPAPDVIYGQPIVFAGVLTACTEYSADTSGTLQCTSIDANPRHVRVARAAPYDGPCADLSADQTTGRWVCLSVRSAGAAPAEPNSVSG